jgi:hypothetical protein
MHTTIEASVDDLTDESRRAIDAHIVQTKVRYFMTLAGYEQSQHNLKVERRDMRPRRETEGFSISPPER